MATVTVGNNISGMGANPMYDAILALAWGGDFTVSMDGSSATTTYVDEFTADSLQVTFHGTDLDDANGIITSFEYGFNGSQDFVVSGINIPAGAMSGAIASAAMDPPDYTPLTEIFRGMDLDADLSEGSGPVFFSGLAGDDDVTLTAFEDFYGLDGGDDNVDLGAGNDLIVGFNAFNFHNSGTVTLDGGDGTDTLQLNQESAFTGSATVDLLRPTIDLGVGFDLIMTNVENIIGSFDQDKLLGSNEANSIDGGGGGDKITGRGGADTLTGSFGVKDVFIYKKADDSAYGDAHDVITNFEHKLDDIDLSALDPKGKLDHFNIVKGKLNDAGDLRIVEHEGEGEEPGFTTVEGTLDGKGKPDFQIELTGIGLDLNKGDFIL